MIVLGLAGRAGSGKTLAANHLVATRGFTRVPFAKPIKDMMLALGLSVEDVYGGNKDRPHTLLNGKTPRWAMQSLGTEWGRNLIDPDLWIRAWAYNCRGLTRIVADDVRFPNEVSIIHEMGGRVCTIQRPAEWMLTDENHPSENQKLRFDDHLLNYWSRQKFLEEIDRLADRGA